MSQRDDLEARVVQRAMSDPQFRQELLSNPGGAIEDELGIPVPAGVKVQVVEGGGDTEYIVLPPSEAQASGEDTEVKGLTWSAESNGCSC